MKPPVFQRDLHSAGKAWRGLAAALALGATLPAHALDIQASFATAGQVSALAGFSFRSSLASSLTGGGSFESVINAAVGTWESLLHDDRVVNITFGWNALASGTVAQSYLGGDAVNEIAFNRAMTHYADPTPTDSAEYSGYAETSANLGGGVINTSRGYTSGPTAADLYSTVLHEIGHVLGNPLNGPYVPGTPNFTVTGGPFAGTALACGDTRFCAHLDVAGALMGTTGGAAQYERTLISGVDLLYVATDGGYTQYHTALVGEVPEPASALLLAAGLGGLGLRARRRRG